MVPNTFSYTPQPTYPPPAMVVGPLSTVPPYRPCARTGAGGDNDPIGAPRDALDVEPVAVLSEN